MPLTRRFPGIGPLLALTHVLIALSAHTGHPQHHHCRPCDRAWGRHHHWHPPAPPFHLGVTEACEAGRESGAGSIVNRTNALALAHYINWHMESGGYEGGYSWLPSTWQSQRPGNYPARAVDATPEQQTMVFRRWKSVSQWPPLAYCL